MERKVGEVFKYDDIVLKVAKSKNCNRCFFDSDYCNQGKRHKIAGCCSAMWRRDNVGVKFIKK